MTDSYDLAELVAARATGDGYTVLTDRVVTRPAGAYVALYFTTGHAYSDNLAASVSRLRWTFRAVCVGKSRKQCLNTAELVRARFTRWRPFGAGPMFFQLDDDPPVSPDDAISNDVRFVTTLTYRLHATRS